MFDVASGASAPITEWSGVCWIEQRARVQSDRREAVNFQANIDAAFGGGGEGGVGSKLVDMEQGKRKGSLS